MSTTSLISFISYGLVALISLLFGSIYIVSFKNNIHDRLR